MNKLKSENYIVIPAWATQEPYNLKHNELIIFSIIYGFCQHKGQCFCGSISYLAEWVSSSRQGVSKNLNSLIKKGFIRKESAFPTNRYYIVNQTPVYEEFVNEDLNNVEIDVKKVDNECKQILDNNIDNNTNNNINKYLAEKAISSSIEEIINYLNKICNTQFKAASLVTKKLIKQRLKEGFTVEDFKRIIDFKYNEWGVKPITFSNGKLSTDYLRPTTLFGDNFESYLNESYKSIKTYNSQSSTPLEERSKFEF